MPIPKVIHQIYLQGEANIPDNIKKSVSELRQRNPDWEYRLYDESKILDYIKRYYGEDTLKIYLLINENYAAARSDFFRMGPS